MSSVPGAFDAPVSVPKPKPEAHAFERFVTWKSAVVVSLGGSLLVAVSLATIAGDLGPASVFVWSIVALFGIVECLLIAEMAGMFPNKAGGTATYTHEAFKHISPLIGAISNWGYWLGWIPVVAVNLILAAGYLKSFMPHLTDNQVLGIAVVMAVVLYIVNYFGLKPGVWSSAVMAICALFPMIVIAFSPIFRHSLFHAGNVFPFVPLGGSWHSKASWMLIFKDMFLAVWSAYAFEAASTVIAEMKNPHKEAPKAMIGASVVGVFAYVVVPFMVLAIVGVSLLSQDPSVAFLPAAKEIFGSTGGTIVSVMLIAALLLGAQTAIIGSSRTVYEMSRDGLILKQMARLNKFGVPVGSILWDGTVTVALLLIFKANVVNMVAASNVGYMLTFMLVTPAFILLRIQQPKTPRSFKLPDWFVGVAWAATIFNWFIFFVGGAQWGKTVMMTGSIIMLTFVPFYLIRRKLQGVDDVMTGPLAHAGDPTLAPESSVELSGRHEVFHNTPEVVEG